MSEDRFTAILRCAGHAYHHVGQIVYLQRELLKKQYRPLQDGGPSQRRSGSDVMSDNKYYVN